MDQFVNTLNDLTMQRKFLKQIVPGYEKNHTWPNSYFDIRNIPGAQIKINDIIFVYNKLLYFCEYSILVICKGH